MQKENPLNYMLLEEETINYREFFEKYLFHWKWFLIGLVLAIVGAYTYLRYTPNQYKVATTILIDDEKSGGLPSELSAFEDLGLTGGGGKSIDNEIGILKSRTLMQRVVKELGINVTYYKQGRVQTSEIHQNDAPFKINFFQKDADFYKLDTTFTIQVISDTQFKLGTVKGKATDYSFGENVTTDFGAITVTPNGEKKNHH